MYRYIELIVLLSFITAILTKTLELGEEIKIIRQNQVKILQHFQPNDIHIDTEDVSELHVHCHSH